MKSENGTTLVQTKCSRCGRQEVVRPSYREEDTESAVKHLHAVISDLECELKKAHEDVEGLRDTEARGKANGEEITKVLREFSPEHEDHILAGRAVVAVVRDVLGYKDAEIRKLRDENARLEERMEESNYDDPDDHTVTELQQRVVTLEQENSRLKAIASSSVDAAGKAELEQAAQRLSVLARLFHSNADIDFKEDHEYTDVCQRVNWLAGVVDRGVRNSNVGRTASKVDESSEIKRLSAEVIGLNREIVESNKDSNEQEEEIAELRDKLDALSRENEALKKKARSKR
ncbi:MAG: hypothetical protein ACHREM_19215 [Polyangiales bacterium]